VRRTYLLQCSGFVIAIITAFLSLLLVHWLVQRLHNASNYQCLRSSMRVFCDLAALCPSQVPLVLLFSQRIKQLWKTESLLISWQESYRSLDVGKSAYALYSHCMSPIIIYPDAQTGALPQLRSHLLQLFVETHDAASPFVALPATDTVRRIAPNMQNMV